MKNLKEYINESTILHVEFPEKKDFKTKSGITSVYWQCGNDAVREYLSGASSAYNIKVMPWFERYKDRIDTISVSIYKTQGVDSGSAAFEAVLYFNINEIGGRATRFVDVFKSAADAKNKMYDVLCKVRDDKDIFRKMSNFANSMHSSPDEKFITYDDFMNL